MKVWPIRTGIGVAVATTSLTTTFVCSCWTSVTTSLVTWTSVMTSFSTTTGSGAWAPPQATARIRAIARNRKINDLGLLSQLVSFIRDLRYLALARAAGTGLL